MISYKYVVSDKQGLHATNAMSLCRAASDYESSNPERGTKECRLQECTCADESGRPSGRVPGVTGGGTGRRSGGRFSAGTDAYDFMIHAHDFVIS